MKTDHLPNRAGTRKLAARWAGPFKVIQLVGSAAARLELPTSFRIHPVFHYSQLKRHLGSAPTMGEAPVYPVADAEEEEYEVEMIL